MERPVLILNTIFDQELLLNIKNPELRRQRQNKTTTCRATMATRTSEQSRKVKVKGKEARAARRSVCNSFTTYTAFQVVPGLEKRSTSNSMFFVIVLVSLFQKGWFLNLFVGSFWENDQKWPKNVLFWWPNTNIIRLFKNDWIQMHFFLSK